MAMGYRISQTDRKGYTVLLIFTQFILKSAIKSPIYLLNPVVVKEENIVLPRLSNLHYLELEQDVRFPVRTLPYLSSVPKNKKIPVYNVTDLVTKEGTSTLHNKLINQEVRKWALSSLKEFKNINLLETPNSDINIVPVYNYNLLKDLYNYKTSLLTTYYKYFNIFTTYWHTVKEAISKDTNSHQFVKINVPNTIPNFNIINVMLKFNNVKFARVVTDINLIQVIDLYRWLTNANRNTSTLKDITDEDSKRIIIEFSYKGYSTFLPLHLLRAMCRESELESEVKTTEVKVQRLYIIMLIKMQNKINSLLDEETPDITEPEHTTDETVKDLKEDELEDYDTEEQSDTEIPLSDITKPKKPILSKLKKKLTSTKDNELENVFNIASFDKILDSVLNDIDNSEADELFEKTIIEVDEDTTEKSESGLTINTDQAYIESILKDKTLDDHFDLYIKEVSKFKLLTAQEIRTLKKTHEARKQLVSPFNEDINIDVFKQLSDKDLSFTSEDTKLDIKNDLVSEDLKKEVILNFDKKYVNDVLQKDIVACVTNIEKSGVIIKDYSITEQSSVAGTYYTHKLTLKPLHGKDSTIYFRLPKIDSEGEFVAAGVRCRMRKQKADLCLFP